MRFRIEPHLFGPSFSRHLGPRHHFDRVPPFTRDQSGRVGNGQVLADRALEQRLGFVREEPSLASTAIIGDGINDAPAKATTTVGIALGQNCGITAEAAQGLRPVTRHHGSSWVDEGVTAGFDIITAIHWFPAPPWVR